MAVLELKNSPFEAVKEKDGGMIDLDVYKRDWPDITPSRELCR